jgi:hypothetical protein
MWPGAFWVVALLTVFSYVAEAYKKRSITPLENVIVALPMGAFAAFIAYGLFESLNRLYDRIAGEDPRKSLFARPNSVSEPDRDAPAPAASASEHILAAQETVTESPRPQPLPAPGPAEDVPDEPTAAPPPDDSLFWFLLYLLPLALFLLAWALGATSLAALGAALCPGLPAGFLVGALAVRWARQSYLSRRRPP